jgi:dihydroorotate dehydrogenase
MGILPIDNQSGRKYYSAIPNRRNKLMRLRGIEFGDVWIQSGTLNFFGEGYPYHKFWKPFGLTFKGSTFVAKTTTVPPREGMMPLKEDGLTPTEWIPKCIYVDLWKGIALNAVSLSGPGFKALLDMGLWQKMLQRFMISYMSAETTVEARLQETRRFVNILNERLDEFLAPFAIQRNYSCPNVGAVPRPEEEFLDEVMRDLIILGRLNVPIVVKLSVTTPPKVALRIAQMEECDCIHITNTVAWGALPDKIDWKGLFGTETSPLMARVGFGGGLSGWPLWQLVMDWLIEARDLRFPKPIAAGGGIMGPDDVWPLIVSGAQAICVGSGLSIMRPWLMQKTISKANQLFLQQRQRYPFCL